MHRPTLRPLRFARILAVSLGALIGLVSFEASAYQHDIVNPTAALSEEAKLVLDAQAEADSEEAEIAATASTTSSGCSVTPTHTGYYTGNTTDGQKRIRKFQVQLPGNYSRTHAYPLVFVFHGAGASSATAYSWGLQNTPGAKDNAIFVYPQGIQYQNIGIGWDDSKNGYDMPFFDNMVKAMEGAYCINTKRIYAAGFSWGGDFVTALVCARGTVLRAAAANSTTDEYRNINDSTTYDNSPCPSPTHPPVRFVHAVNGDSEYPAPLFNTTSKLFRRFNVCSTSATAVKSASTSGGMSCVSYNSCSRQVVECTFSNSIGHNLPPYWAQDTWAFFNAYQ